MTNINSLNLTLPVKKYFPNSRPNKTQKKITVIFASSLLSYLVIFSNILRFQSEQFYYMQIKNNPTSKDVFDKL